MGVNILRIVTEWMRIVNHAIAEPGIGAEIICLIQ